MLVSRASDPLVVKNVRHHVASRVFLVAIVLCLGGCASGSCSIHQLLQPTAAATSDFTVNTEPEYDSLFLEGRSISLWLKPCNDPQTRALIQGSLCGSVIVSPGTTFQFAEPSVRVMGIANSVQRTISVEPSDFDLAKIQVGSSKPGVSGLASRPYKLPGSRLNFTVLRQADAPGPSILRLPTVQVNSVAITFPQITITPSTGRRCYHGAW
jgi:hypothetical protein